ncbi:substrate-binding domain-containing protein [Nostocoides sp. HKS02]|uniref:sugar ABC transporter substrate-binding protein n=1 Tax=Nostocoides sp. HKS02 TaxID=1813880 RepID=UPI0018A82750|nr:substrate-binding domain-containing protein [Tetrasphaera sp. HKS02]
MQNAQSLVSASTPEPAFVAPGPKFDPSKARGKTVYAIPVSASVPFNVYVGKYLTEALSKFDIKTVYYSTTGQSSQWVAGMNTAISQHAAAIDLIGLDPAALQPQIAAAKAAGIPVIVDHFLDTSHTDYAGYKDVAGIVGAPYNLAGQLEAAYAINDTKGSGTFLLVESPDLLSSTDVAVGIEAEFAKDCPSCHVVKVDVPFNDWSTRMQTAVSSALTRYPDTTYVLPVFDGMVQYVIPAITAAGKTDTVKLASYNATPFALDFLAKGNVVTMNLGESFSWLGYALADQTLRLMVGQPALSDEKVPVRVFTSANVSQTGNPPAINTGYGNAYLAGYQALWGLSG